jgi:hypothetical protein
VGDDEQGRGGLDELLSFGRRQLDGHVGHLEPELGWARRPGVAVVSCAATPPSARRWPPRWCAGDSARDDLAAGRPGTRRRARRHTRSACSTGRVNPGRSGVRQRVLLHVAAVKWRPRRGAASSQLALRVLLQHLPSSAR